MCSGTPAHRDCWFETEIAAEPIARFRDLRIVVDEHPTVREQACHLVGEHVGIGVKAAMNAVGFDQRPVVDDATPVDRFHPVSNLVQAGTARRPLRDSSVARLRPASDCAVALAPRRQKDTISSASAPRAAGGRSGACGPTTPSMKAPTMKAARAGVLWRQCVDRNALLDKTYKSFGQRLAIMNPRSVECRLNGLGHQRVGQPPRRPKPQCGAALPVPAPKSR